MKYKVVTSIALALMVAGCGVGNNDNGRKNVGLNTSNRNGTNSTQNVNNGLNRTTNRPNVNDVNNPTINRPNMNNVNNPTINRPNTNNVRNVGYNRNFNDNNFTLSDDIANRVAGLKEVKSANVLLTNHTAYVAAVLNNDEGGNVSTKVENKIADTVRGVDKTVDRVYVSTNPDFVDRVTRYANDVGKGRPVTGFGKQFGELVNRIFPNPR